MNRRADGRHLTTEDLEDLAHEHLGLSREKLRALRGEKQKATRSHLVDLTRELRHALWAQGLLFLDTSDAEVSGVPELARAARARRAEREAAAAA